MSTENIIVRMRGGLGNQLFQLAYGMFLKKEYNAQKLILDTEEFRHYHIRGFELGHFNLDGIIITNHIQSYKYLISRNIYHILQDIKRRISAQELDLYPFFTRLGLFYAGINPGVNRYANNRKNIYVYGYFQNVTYVDAVKSEIFRIFNIDDSLREEYKKTKHPEIEYIAVSIRCGKDYKQAGYPICTSDYYNRALRYIMTQKKDRQFRIRVFTDDAAQAKKIINCDCDMEFIGEASPVQQLLIMMDCDHFVISNSSFSWWGAYLAKNKEKIVVAPVQWYPSPFLNTENTQLVYKNMVIL